MSVASLAIEDLHVHDVDVVLGLLPGDVSLEQHLAQLGAPKMS